MSRNPLHEDDKGWWFWDETWCDRYGPFSTKRAAIIAMEEYCHYLGIPPRKEHVLNKMRATWFVISWTLWLGLVELPLMILGIPLVAIAALAKAYEERESLFYAARKVLVWKWSWMWLWGNEEDGIDGAPTNEDGEIEFRQHWWIERAFLWTPWKRILTWSALRNSVSNLRFTRWGGFRPHPGKINYYLLDDASQDGVDTSKHWFCWQGWRGRYHYENERRVFEIGWKVRPGDTDGIAMTDPRRSGVGFGLRLKRINR